MQQFHHTLAWVAVTVDGLVGVWGLLMAFRRTSPGRPFWVGVGIATSVMLAQVSLGVYLVSGRGIVAGDQHVFYGIVVAFMFGFAYIYRSQLARRPALYYGLFFLFVMGLGLRAIATFGMDF